ncbi:73 kDa subunit [Hexamita inflata]|uniref:73 kDa subunit n=1 Tax=Hexamita inflata TaxID=28002 RepID=A0AA86RKB8_9EUKA|nr:73 kDa subunit [Hexamita inflata]CAI9978262.1 73 kDa subunit [Hexamita inflata]
MKSKVTVTPLGAAKEVGRSCYHIEYERVGVKGAFLFDCGINPSISESNSLSDVPALPFFDLLTDLQPIDFILITHFHNDHASGLPSLISAMRRQDKIVPIYMTPDTCKVLRDNFRDMLAQGKIFPQLPKGLERNEAAVQAVEWIFQQYKPISFNETLKLTNNLQITAYSAGHVIGAAMYNVNLNNFQVFYTGDYSMEKDRHLNSADVPKGLKPDILMTEGTYGTLCHSKRTEREAKFIEVCISTLKKGGKVLLPVFSVGRVQELISILDWHWQQHIELQQYKIYYISSVGHKYKTQTEKYITYAENEKMISKNEPSIIFCTPGMLQSGVSRKLFEEYGVSDKNTLLVTGYGASGSLLHALLQKERKGEVLRLNSAQSGVIEVKMKIVELSFSAHSDYSQTCDLLNQIRPKNLILIHGSRGALDNLEQKLKQDIKTGVNEQLLFAQQSKMEIIIPEIGERVKFDVAQIVQAQWLKQDHIVQNVVQELVVKQQGVEFQVIDQQSNKTQIELKLGIDVRLQGNKLLHMLQTSFGSRSVTLKAGCQWFTVNILELMLTFQRGTDWNEYRRLIYYRKQTDSVLKQEMKTTSKESEANQQQIKKLLDHYKEYNIDIQVIGYDQLTREIVAEFEKSCNYLQVVCPIQHKEVIYYIFNRILKDYQETQLTKNVLADLLEGTIQVEDIVANNNLIRNDDGYWFVDGEDHALINQLQKILQVWG